MNDNITISRERLRQVFFNTYPAFIKIQELAPDSSGFCSHEIPTQHNFIEIHWNQLLTMLNLNADFLGPANIGDKPPDFVLCDCGQRFAAPATELMGLLERHAQRDHKIKSE